MGIERGEVSPERVANQPPSREAEGLRNGAVSNRVEAKLMLDREAERTRLDARGTAGLVNLKQHRAPWQ